MTAPGATRQTAALIAYGSAHDGAGWWCFDTPSSGSGRTVFESSAPLTVWAATLWSPEAGTYVPQVIYSGQRKFAAYLSLGRRHWVEATDGVAVGAYEEYWDDWTELRDSDGSLRVFAHRAQLEKQLTWNYTDDPPPVPYAGVVDRDRFMTNLAAANTVAGATPVPVTGTSSTTVRSEALSYFVYAGNQSAQYGARGMQQVVGFSIGELDSFSVLYGDTPADAVAHQFESARGTYAGRAMLYVQMIRHLSGTEPVTLGGSQMFGTGLANRLPVTYRLKTAGPLADLESDYDPTTGDTIEAWSDPSNRTDPTWRGGWYDRGSDVWDVSAHVEDTPELGLTLKTSLDYNPDEVTMPGTYLNGSVDDSLRTAKSELFQFNLYYDIHAPRIRWRRFRPILDGVLPELDETTPPRRIFPRDDGRAASSAPRRFPVSKSEQSSNRRVGGYL